MKKKAVAVERSSGRDERHRRVIGLAVLLVLVSPLFGVFLADMVGYHEPLDVAAEALRLRDLTEAINWTPLMDYTVPGLPAGLGYVVSGLIGIGVILAVGLILERWVGFKGGESDR
ncbi:MAG: PDGLE domain-containing protein [Candidatus Bathyarchaeia archaeon]